MINEARVLARRTEYTSPWFVVLAKDVRLPGEAELQTYFSVKPPDYVTIVALTPDGRVPLVHQYRPVVEDYTLELPSGHVDGDEAPEAAARRELLEETGCRAGRMIALPGAISDTGRMENRIWAYVAPDVTVEGVPTEHGIDVRFHTPAEVRALVRAGRICNALHLAVLGLAAFTDEVRFP
jgi:ADP-ribose pyrophosphatase